MISPQCCACDSSSGMEVARQNFSSKIRAITPDHRTTSCSSGWLRLVLQSIFAAITVISFILIVIMSVKKPSPSAVSRPPLPSRCLLQNCRVVCNDAPYYEDYEDDILFAVVNAENQCGRVYLELHNPAFTNATLPCNWLSRLPHGISQLAIFGGNLMHIPSEAFISQFAGSILILHLHDLRIKTLGPNSLVGLSKLRTLNILHSWLENVEDNALRAVDDTLETLTVIQSADWNPTVLTGFRGLERLTIVDFSYNDFNNILDNRCFVGLNLTKILYLNSCRITSIGTGAFDYLKSIEVLYLNNNLLTTIPVGLFATIIPLNNPRPRVHLQDNYWHCDCESHDLRQLIREEILLVEVKCTTPTEFYSKPFTKFDAICDNNNTEEDVAKLINYKNKNKNRNKNKKQYINSYYTETVYINRTSCQHMLSRTSSIIVSAMPNNVCTSKKFRYVNLTNFVQTNSKISRNILPPNNKWINYSYFLKSDSYSVVQIRALSNRKGYGLFWYQPECPQEINCFDVLPTNLNVYNADPAARYIFCPVHIKNASVNNDECFEVSSKQTEPSYYENNKVANVRWAVYLISMMLCSCFGAVIVYGLIRKKPTLLKGSKRILFVKHKNIDALVLPPKIPVRDDLIDCKNEKVFSLTSGNNERLKPPNVQRMKSVRSDKSGTPSYISAMQPTEEQLAEWRVRHHFNDDHQLTVSSGKSEVSTLSWIDTSYYYSLDDDRTYESLK